ncbi:MAG: tetratricopeptide repeat protein [Planctomycetes bacterium]|nr:tetratricopeptide repeat protein [Planctomycetota bacterium]
MRSSPFFAVLFGDGAEYDRWAQRVAAGDWLGSEVFYQAPLYPYFLAVIYRLFGHSLDVVRGVQIVIGSVACGLLALATTRFFDNARLGLLAGALLALHAPAIFFDALIQKSVLDLLFMTLLLLLLAPGGSGANRDQRCRDVAACGGLRLLAIGVVLGGFALTRENALILVPVIAAWAFVANGAAWRVRLGRVGLMLAGLAVVLLPVGVRNLAVGGEFVLTTAQMGPNFYIGNHPAATGSYQPLRKWRAEVKYERLDATELAQADLGRELTAGEVSRYWMGRAFEFIATEPGAWARLLARKWMMVWNACETTDTESIEAYRDASRVLHALGSATHFGVIAPLAAMGMWWTRRDWMRLWSLYAILLAIAAGVALFYVFARYRYPMVPILAMFAAVGIAETARQVRAGAWRPLAIPGALLLATAAAANAPQFAQLNPQAITYTNLAGALSDAGRLDDAKAAFQAALRVAPDLPETHFALASFLEARGDYVGAETHLRAALRGHPDLAELHAALGRALVQRGSPADAIDALTTAVRLEPASEANRLQLADALGRTGRTEEAGQHLQEAIRLKPRSVAARYNLGNLRMREQKFDAAIALYQEVLRIDAGHVGTLNNLGIALVQTGRLSEAREQFQAAIRLHPQHPEAYNNFGRTLMQEGKSQEAAEYFRAALRIAPEHAAAKANLQAATRAPGAAP